MNPEQLIARYRQEIDRLDSQILELLNRRAECAMEIGRVKRQNGQPIHVPDRERAVLTRLSEENRGPLSADSIHEVFRAIFEQMKRLEREVDPA
jgi:chorismate mutase-like protein